MAPRPREGHGQGMQTRRESERRFVVPASDSAAFDETLRAAVGYRVVVAEGDGVVTAVPEAGRPSRPLLLVVRVGNTFRFIPRRHVERVLPQDRCVLVEMGESRDGDGRVSGARSSPDPSCLRAEERTASVSTTGEERVPNTAEDEDAR